ncbi:MAG: flagellar biosynthesis protein FlhB [Clostridiaceae bacterium]
MEDKHSKTEEATPKKISDSKKKGQVPKSADFNSAFSSLVFAMLLGSLGQYLFSHGLETLRATLRTGFGASLSSREASHILLQSVARFSILFLPFGLLAVILGVVTNLIQVGFIYSVDPIKPDFKRLNPLQGFKNIFSVKSLFNMLKSVLKLVIVSWITYQGLTDILVQITNAGLMGIENLYTFFFDIIKTLSLSIARIMIILGIVDFIVQKREFKKNLRMTKEEIKTEYKQMEGDPKIKSARQQKQREMSRRRTLQNVEQASVIITNPTHIAIALKYELGKDQAPIVVGKGVDYMAQKIKEKAKEKGIPIIENKPLARAMYPKVEEGSFVPIELYQAIAEILALVYQMEKNKKIF